MIIKTTKSDNKQVMNQTSMINSEHIALNCFVGWGGGTHSTSAQCSGEQITRGNTERCNSADRIDSFQSTETAQCLPFNLSIHQIENKRTDNRNLFSHNWKNLVKKFKKRATNFLAPFQRFVDTLIKHLSCLLKARPLFSLWQQLRSNVWDLENLTKLKTVVQLLE